MSNLAAEDDATEIRDHIDKALGELVAHREHISFAQVGRLFAVGIPLRLSLVLLVTLGGLISGVFSLGWNVHKLYQRLPESASRQESNLTPEEVVDRYFTFLSSGHHEQAWTMISKGSYEPWIRFWSTVGHVSVLETVIVSQTSHESVVRVRLEYQKTSGGVVKELARLYLIRNAQNDPWKINKYERISSR